MERPGRGGNGVAGSFASATRAHTVDTHLDSACRSFACGFSGRDPFRRERRREARFIGSTVCFGSFSSCRATISSDTAEEEYSVSTCRSGFRVSFHLYQSCVSLCRAPPDALRFVDAQAETSTQVHVPQTTLVPPGAFKTLKPRVDSDDSSDEDAVEGLAGGSTQPVIAPKMDNDEVDAFLPMLKEYLSRELNPEHG